MSVSIVSHAQRNIQLFVVVVAAAAAFVVVVVVGGVLFCSKHKGMEWTKLWRRRSRR